MLRKYNKECKKCTYSGEQSSKKMDDVVFYIVRLPIRTFTIK
jgi:hypothetical protein